MAWNASLEINYSLRELSGSSRTVARHLHTGPLRILQSLYPEGDSICHNVLVHPPGGLVGGDTLNLNVRVEPGAHGLLTTPGATRFYRSEDVAALQLTNIDVAANARMEWLPLESIAFNGCLAENRLAITLAPGAEMLGWDVTALGLPAASKHFESGHFCQHLEMPGIWLERASIKALDHLLLNSPTGMAGHRCFATLFFATGSGLMRQRRQDALDIARKIIEAHPLCPTAGATSPNGQIVLVRVLAPVVEPAMALLRSIWLSWRHDLWRLDTKSPRIWST